MKSGFVELVMKVAKKDRMPINISGFKKTSMLNTFKEFTQNILPEMEKRIEVELLKETLRTTKSKSIRSELINAYLRRLSRLNLYKPQEPLAYQKPLPMAHVTQVQPSDPTITKPLKEHSFYDVGYYYEFLNDDMNTVFKHECFGRYKEMEYYGTNKFGVMIREESIAIVEALKRIQNPKSVEWNNIAKMTKRELKEYLNDEENYMHLFNELSNAVYAEAKKYRGKEHFTRIWGSSVISDTIVNSILRNLSDIQNPLHYAKRCVRSVMYLKHPPSPSDFHEVESLNVYPRIELVNKMPKNANFFWKTPSFKNVFLGGEGGTGKSMILTYISMWAHKNNWVTINLPNAHHLNNGSQVLYRRAYDGLFITEDYAMKWLEQFRSSNLEFLKKTKVNKELYGKINYTGVHDEEYDPIPNLYDPQRRSYFNDTDKLGPERDLAEEAIEKEIRVGTFLRNPETLDDICIAGIKDEKLATSAIGELLQQIYELDVPTLVCADAFNWFYRPSSFKSFRYFNDNGLYGRVPPQHIAISRLFMHLDGHRIKRGLKVVTSSNHPLHNHTFDIEKIMLPKEYEHKVRAMNLDEFANAAKFNIRTRWWPADALSREQPNYMYMLCQGNWQDFHTAIRSNHYL